MRLAAPVWCLTEDCMISCNVGSLPDADALQLRQCVKRKDGPRVLQTNARQSWKALVIEAHCRFTGVARNCYMSRVSQNLLVPRSAHSPRRPLVLLAKVMKYD